MLSFFVFLFGLASAIFTPFGEPLSFPDARTVDSCFNASVIVSSGLNDTWIWHKQNESFELTQTFPGTSSSALSEDCLRLVLGYSNGIMVCEYDPLLGDYLVKDNLLTGNDCEATLSKDGDIVAAECGLNETVYVFEKEQEKWTLLWSMANPFGDEFAFGWPVVSYNGSVLTIPVLSSYEGFVMLLEREKEEFKVVEYLAPNDTTEESFFGDSVSMNGDGSLVVVGAPEDQNGKGAVWFFQDGVQMGNKTDLSVEVESWFGMSSTVSFSGQITAIGAPGYENGNGQVWVLNGTVPLQDPLEDNNSPLFGSSVHLCGTNWLIVSAQSDNIHIFYMT